MSDPITNDTPTPVIPVPAATPPEPNGGQLQGDSDPSWLPARLQRAEEAARKKLLLDLGIEDPSKGKELIADALKRKEDEMSEVQKAKAKIADLEPKAKRVDEITAALHEMVQKQIDALPKQWQNAVPEFDDPLKTFTWLQNNSALLAPPVIPNLNPGEQHDKLPPPPAQEAQRASNIAAQYGYKVDATKVADRARQLEQQRKQKPTGE